MLLEDLLQIKRETLGHWIIMGDFNTVRRHDERFNSQFFPSTAYAFNRFNGDAELCDLRIGGHGYTYFFQTELKMGKID